MNTSRTKTHIVRLVAVVALLTLTGIAQASGPTGYLVVPGHHAGTLGDNQISVTATDLEPGVRYQIKLEVSYHENLRTPPADGVAPPGYTETIEWDSDGSDHTHVFDVPLPDCHYQITAGFTLYYLDVDVSPPDWSWNGDTRGTQGVDIWSDCEDGGAGGCTPGYWKNRKNLDKWPPELDPDDDFDGTFGVNLFPGITLGEAIRLGGGGDRKLARHGTAALLSAWHADVDYPLSPDDVIAAVQAGDADMLAGYNELGCPLNSK